ncbi:MAG TPA: TonB-dependent receptor [Bacteroidales bacterium]|nr:TonB-dependent receptor [Bacteroidales bacterium]
MEKRSDPRVGSHPTLKKLIIELKIAVLLFVAGAANVFAGQLGSGVAPANGLFSGTEVNYQQGKVTGKVTDKNGAPLGGVTVLVKGTASGAITESDGSYSIVIPEGGTVLSFSFVGMTAQDIPIGSQSVINVTLQETSIGLDEVVVVGYGTQKKVNLTGSIATTDVKKLENRPMTNVSQALQGMNGLYVNQAGGQPGRDGATIRIRGVGTLNDNNPLVLIDGIAYSLSDINPNEIESISVLKDAASTAVYGSRAANGVILITTKKGKRNEAYKVDYNTYFGIEKPTYLPDVEWDPITYMQFKNQALQNEGKAIEYPQASIDEYNAGMDSNPYFYPRSNWFDMILQNGKMQEHNLTISGGGANHNMSLTMGYLNQGGIIHNINGNKYNLGLNAKVDINKFLSVGGRISGIYRKFNEPWNGMSSYWQGVYRSLPIYPVRIEDGRWGNAWLRTAGHNNFMNPVERLEEGNNDFVQQRLLGNLFADLKLPFNIIYRVNAAVNKYDGKNQLFQPFVIQVNPKTLEEQQNTSYAQGFRQYNDNLNTTFFHTLEWSKKIAESHNLFLLLGNSYESFTSSFFSSQKQTALDNSLTDLDVFAQNPVVAGNSSKSALLSYFGRMNYSFQEKYLLEVNFRYDGSSRFARGNRWGFFPSFSLGWRLDQEQFMQNVGWITSLKPRFSWGRIGNQEIPLFAYVNSVNLGRDYTFGTTVFQGAAVTASSDPKISWETTTMTNLGFDAGFFDNKLSLTVELYNKDTRDILRPVNLPTQVGNWTGPTSNIGQVNNKGIEISTNFRNSWREINFEIGGDFAYNKNNVVNLNGQQIISGRYITAEGHPIDSYYIYEAIGFFQTDQEVSESPFQNVATKAGFIKYKDQNGDNKIDASDRVIVHGVVPEITYSFNMGVGYKGFDLSALFQGVGKIYTYPQHNISYPFYNGAGFTKEWETDAWTPDNPNAPLPIITTSTGNTLNFQNSTFWLQNASYLRLKNLQLGYTFAPSLINKLSMKQLKVFVNAQNMLTFSKMKKFDPEKNMKNDNIFEYPSIKILSFGLNVTF